MSSTDDGGRAKISGLPRIPGNVSLIAQDDPMKRRYEIAFKPESDELKINFTNATNFHCVFKFVGDNGQLVQPSNSRIKLRRLEPSFELPKGLKQELKKTWNRRPRVPPAKTKTLRCPKSSQLYSGLLL